MLRGTAADDDAGTVNGDDFDTLTLRHKGTLRNHVDDLLTQLHGARRTQLREHRTLPIDEDLFYAELQKKIASSSGKKESVKKVVVEDMSSTYGS